MFIMALGVYAVDVVTGFEGVITGRVEYLTGCRQYLVQPKAKDGAYTEARWLDEDRLRKSGKKSALTLKTNNVNGACESAPVK